MLNDLDSLSITRFGESLNYVREYLGSKRMFYGKQLIAVKSKPLRYSNIAAALHINLIRYKR